MFKIGDFSKFSRVSIKMLRHYDELGLLKPAHVDTFTGYRYYSAGQLSRLNRIVALKELGFTLQQIAQFLDEDLSTEEMRGMLKLKRAEVEQRIETEQQRLAQLDSRLLHLNQQVAAPQYDVVLRSVKAAIYATKRATVPALGPAIQFMFEDVEKYVARYKARASQPPLTLFHDSGYDEDSLDVEVAVPVSAAIPSNAEITIRELPGVSSMACVVHTGAYSAIDDALAALMTWIEANGYQISGPMREVYLRFGADQVGYTVPDAYLTDTSAEFITELQIPVEKDNA